MASLTQVATGRVVDQVGRVVGGRYRLLKPLGSGGSALVFLAQDTDTGAKVAVKVLSPGLGLDEVFLRRYRAEVLAASVLSHRHIVKVLDWGEEDDGPWLVMEHMAAGSLRDLMDEGQLLTIAQATSLGAKAAQALAYAHSRGVVHRDIKPANVLFDAEGRPAISDFGLARALAEAAWTEPVGAVLATARYSSPEQALGRSLDGRSDVYSLGLVLAEAVSGRAPFSADTTIGTLMARVASRFEAPAELGPLGPVVEAACALEPSERPDAATLARVLTDLAETLPVPTPVVPLAPPPWLEPPPPTPPAAELAAGELARPGTRQAGLGRHRRWRFLAALVGAAVGLGAAAFAIFGLRVLVPSHPVPSLRGKSLAQARSELVHEHLELKVVGRHFDPSVPRSLIVSQSPPASTMLKEGSVVSVVLSRGPRPVRVPDLSGLDEVGAISALARAGLRADISRAYSDTVPAGKVVSFQPSSGTYPPGTVVSVVISEGPQPRAVPNLAGDSPQDASSQLQALGLGVAQVQQYSSSVRAGEVIGTSPPAGATVLPGQTVTLYVSRGPQLVVVPSVSGDSVSQATSVMAQAGLGVANVFGPPTGTVFTTNPTPGTDVPKGSSVNLYTR